MIEKSARFLHMTCYGCVSVPPNTLEKFAGFVSCWKCKVVLCDGVGKLTCEVVTILMY
jgi:hypothetical protein